MPNDKIQVQAKEVMTVEMLKVTHELYDTHINAWKLYRAAYDGIEALLKGDYIKKHVRESQANWEKRRANLFSFEYSRSVVDLFNFYQFKEPTKITTPDALKNDKQWEMFNDDANLYGDGFDEVFKNDNKKASIQGHMGLLVDKSSNTVNTKAEEIEQKVYPYICSFAPPAILDWQYDKDENNRPYLSYLKLQDEDDLYRVWYVDQWEVWEIQQKDGKEEAVLIASGLNPIGEIPFVWLYNIRSTKRFIGTSDIQAIARIDLSIIRNLSQGEEVVEYAAFPMLLKPKEENPDDTVGPKAVLEFDPDHPDAKPSWLESMVNDAISAILTWIEKKVEEIYRSANIGGMAATEVQTQAKSGVAMRTEFQMLNSRLIDKGLMQQKARTRVIHFWLLWQQMGELEKEVLVEAPKSYDVDNLAQDLENLITGRSIVKSKEFNIRLQKSALRWFFPYLDEEEYAIMDKEIEENAEFIDFESQINPAAAAEDKNTPSGEDKNKNTPTKEDEE